jgi:DnaJ-class molecular chaperone
LKEALCGFTFSIKYLDERTFKIENRNGNVISPGYNKIIPGLGMVREKNDNDAPKSANKGNLVIVFTVTFPDKLTKEQTEKIEECFPE